MSIFPDLIFLSILSNIHVMLLLPMGDLVLLRAAVVASFPNGPRSSSTPGFHVLGLCPSSMSRAGLCYPQDTAEMMEGGV